MSDKKGSKKSKADLAKLAKNATVNLLDQFATTPDAADKVTLPPTLKIADLEGKTVGGKIVSFNAFKKGKQKGTIIVLEHANGNRFGLPMTASIRYAIARYIGVDGEDFNGDGATGLVMHVTGRGQGTTRDGKRPVNLFDVYLSKK